MVPRERKEQKRKDSAVAAVYDRRTKEVGAHRALLQKVLGDDLGRYLSAWGRCWHFKNPAASKDHQQSGVQTTVRER
jgi:hypothetical protein